MIIKFTTVSEVPSGKAQTKATDIQGYIEISFEGTRWDSKLLYSDPTNIPCKPISGILPGNINKFSNLIILIS